MARDLKIRDEKLQYDINRKTAKISTLSSGKIDVYEYLTGEEMLSSDQSRIIEQAMFTDIGVTILFEHSPSQVSEIDYFEIFRSHEKINLPNVFSKNVIYYCSFSFLNVGSVLCICGEI